MDTENKYLNNINIIIFTNKNFKHHEQNIKHHEHLIDCIS
jgi:hypothetical protein